MMDVDPIRTGCLVGLEITVLCMYLFIYLFIPFLIYFICQIADAL